MTILIGKLGSPNLIEHFFILSTIILIVTILFGVFELLQKKKEAKIDNKNLRDTIKPSSKREEVFYICYLLTIILLIFSWFRISGIFLLKQSIEPEIVPSNEKSIEKIATVYTEDERIEIINVSLEIDDSFISWFDVNRINSRYPIEVLKLNIGGYHAYFRTDNKIMRINFDYYGKVIGMYALKMVDSVDEFDAISLGDNEEKVKELFTDEGFYVYGCGFSSSTHYTKDGYCVEILYYSGEVIKITKSIF